MSRRRACNVSAETLGAPGAWRALPEDAAHYLIRVLRQGEGDEVELRDPDGRRQTAALSLKDGVWGVVGSSEVVQQARPQGREVWLAPALIKASRMTWLLEKAAELGADRLYPLTTARGVVVWSQKQFEGKRPRLERILASGARQSGAHRPPELHPPRSVADQARLLAVEGARLLHADPTAAQPFGVESLGDGAVALFTGPEGGFTGAELEALRDHGSLGVSLGPRILRAETAPIALLATLRLALDP